MEISFIIKLYFIVAVITKPNKNKGKQTMMNIPTRKGKMLDQQSILITITKY